MEVDNIKGEVENAQPIQEVKLESAEPLSSEENKQRQED